jgi:hypothetical protein
MRRALDRRRDALDVRDQLRVQRQVEVARASRTGGIVEYFDHNPEDRESHALDVAAGA